MLPHHSTDKWGYKKLAILMSLFPTQESVEHFMRSFWRSAYASNWKSCDERNVLRIYWGIIGP